MLLLLLWQALSARFVLAAPNNATWEAGRLDYNSGSAEVAAFVNQEQVQLQVVLCSLNLPSAYRLSLFLSNPANMNGLIPVKLLVDGSTTHAYAEVSGNSLELQVSIPFLISLTYSPSLEIVFSKLDAQALNLPETLHIGMDMADLALNEVARSCTLLCQSQGFDCNQPLLSGILWPRQGFDHEGDRSDPSIGSYRQLLGVNSQNSSYQDADNEDDWEQRVVDSQGSSDDVSVSDAEPANANADKTTASTNSPDSQAAQENEDDWKKAALSSRGKASADDDWKQTSDFSADDFNYASQSKRESGSKAESETKAKESNGSNSSSKQDATEDKESDNVAEINQDALNHACLQWPRSMSGYERSISDMYALTPSFNPNKKCKKLLDRRFERDGKWALSFMPTIFKQENSAYQRYQQRWNVLVDALDPEGKLPDTKLNDDDYYLALFTLFTTTNLHEFPQSYFDLLSFSDDPATFLYAMDNRYDLETVKYYAVLERRLKGSISLLQTAAECYKIWEEFYQDFSSALPPIPKAQALRPVIYRQMLMRVWRLAGYPDPLHLRPQYAFVQGTNHRTITQEQLEAKCSAFEGSNGDQFFFASPECIQSIYSDLGRKGFLNEDFKQLQHSWDVFAQACNKTKMLTISGGSNMGENNRAGLALSLLSLYKIYGFGDYFLLRNCLSTRDSDICAFQSFKSQQDYMVEFRNSVSSIAAVSEQDAQTLKQLNDLWRRYYDHLKIYTERLVSRGRIEDWRAHFVQGVAATTQTETLLSGPYYRQPVEPED